MPRKDHKGNPRRPRRNEKQKQPHNNNRIERPHDDVDTDAFLDDSVKRIVYEKISIEDRISLLKQLAKIDDSRYISLIGSDRAREVFLVIAFLGVVTVLRAFLEGINGNSQSMRAFWLNIDTVLFLALQLIKAPLDTKKRATWFSLIGGLNAFLCISISITLIISFLTFSEAGGPILLLSGTCSLLYSILLCAVLIWPALLLNNNIVIVGDYLLLTYCVQFAAGWLARETNLSGLQVMMLTANMMFVSFLLYASKEGEAQLNIIQRIALQVIRPERLMYALRKAYSDIVDQHGAIDIIRELEKAGKYGIIVQIEKQISERYRSAHSVGMKKAVAVVVAIFMATIVAAYEGFVQNSAPYAAAKKYICTEYKWLCEQADKPQLEQK